MEACRALLSSSSSSHRRPPPRCVSSAFLQAAAHPAVDRIGPSELSAFLLSSQEPFPPPDPLLHASSLISAFHRTRRPSSSPPRPLQFHHHHRAAHDGAPANADPLPTTLNLDEFTELLLDPHLNRVMRVSEKPTQDMTSPLSHYFIHSSHNSYLTGNQLTSKSSTVPIANALQEGYRVIELDCWERKGKIVVRHGNTLTKAVPFIDCLKTIEQHAFKASDYPVIITIENHLGPELQKEAAKLIKDVFGDALFVPREGERPPLQFASPEELKNKIIISDSPAKDPLRKQAAADPEAIDDVIPELLTPAPRPDDDSYSPSTSPPGGLVRHPKQSFTQRLGRLTIEALNKDRSSCEEPEEVQPRTLELEELIYISSEKPKEMKNAQVNGELVSGERSIMANVSEPQLRKLSKENPGSLIEYCKRNLGRMYPFGLRFDSSNADPFLAWSHGFQLAALNAQGRDRPCWVARALFDGNGRCGYVRKPQVLLTGGSDAATHQQIAAMPTNLKITISILLGTDWHKAFDLLKEPDFYVKVAIDGMPVDKSKKKTKVAVNTSLPNWEDEVFEFDIRVPEMAIMRLEVWENDIMQKDEFVGQSCFPVQEMNTGIRCVQLKSRDGDLLSSKLLCMIRAEPCL